MDKMAEGGVFDFNSVDAEDIPFKDVTDEEDDD